VDDAAGGAAGLVRELESGSERLGEVSAAGVVQSLEHHAGLVRVAAKVRHACGDADTDGSADGEELAHPLEKSGGRTAQGLRAQKSSQKL